MRKFTALLVSLLTLFSTVISARADLIVEPSVASGPAYNRVVILVLVVIIVAVTLLRLFRKK